MYNKLKSKPIYIIIGVTLFIVILIIILSVAFMSLRAGKHKVTIVALPEDAALFVDGEKTSTPAWVTPGEHTFHADKEGFETDSITRTITGEMTVILLPEATSKEAIAWSNQDDVRQQIEELSGIQASERGSYITENNPLIKELPFTDIAGPFVIDYGYYGPDNTSIYISVHNSTPRGRQNAIKWITDRGFNPAEQDIRFTDFVNPLLGGES